MLFAHRSFLLLLGNEVFTRIAYNLITFTLLVWVFQSTGSNSAVALWMIMFFTASVTFSQVAGVAADHFDRKRIMLFASLIWGVLILGFIPVKQSFPLILLFTLLSQAANEFFIPSQSSSIPQLVKDRHLSVANSVFFFTTYSSIFIGYFLSGILFRFFGYPVPFLLASGLVFLGALFALALPPLRPPEKAPPFGEFFRQLKGKIARQIDFLLHHRRVGANVILLALVFSAIASAGSLAPGFSEQILRIDARDLSFVGVLPMALGFLSGAFLLSRWPGKILNIWQGMLVFAAFLFLLVASPSLRIYLAQHVDTPQAFERFPFFSLAISAMIFGLGFLASTISIPIFTSLQRLTPKRNMGRTFGSVSTLAAIFTTFLVLTFGVTADLFNPTVPVVFVGLVAIGVALWIKDQVVFK